MARKESHELDGQWWNRRHVRRVGSKSADAWQRLVRVCQYSCLYVAGLAVIETTMAMVLLGLEPNPAPAVVGLVTFAVYSGDRIADVDTDALSNPEKSAFVRRNENRLYTAAAVAYGGAVSIAVFGGPVALGVTVLPGAFLVVYTFDWLDGLVGSVHRLKEILVLNSTIVGLAWAVTLTFLPLSFAGVRPSLTAVFVFAYVFVRIFLLAEISNIPDIEADRCIGVDTIPAVWGLRRTRLVLYGLNLLTFALLVAAASAELVPLEMLLPLGIATGYSSVLVSLVGRVESVPLVTQLSDSEHLLACALLLLVTVGL